MVVIHPSFQIMVLSVMTIGIVSSFSISQNIPKELQRGLLKARISQIKKCPPREHFDSCHSNCQRTCTSLNINPALCSPDCQSGCVCNRGYVRSSIGKCIRPVKCSAPDVGDCTGRTNILCIRYCQRKGHSFGHCDGNRVCKCFDN